jgi:hypothetical protein
MPRQHNILPGPLFRSDQIRQIILKLPDIVDVTAPSRFRAMAAQIGDQHMGIRA